MLLISEHDRMPIPWMIWQADMFLKTQKSFIGYEQMVTNYEIYTNIVTYELNNYDDNWNVIRLNWIESLKPST